MVAEGKDDNGTVRWATRRSLVANLTFAQKETYIELEDAIERKFKEISNRQASFQSMSMDEKLAEIANLIENMLKISGKFISLNYASVCFDYIDENTITKYRKRLHCFRHSSPEAISERKSLNEEQKTFLIDFGLTIVKVIHILKQEKRQEDELDA